VKKLLVIEECFLLCNFGNPYSQVVVASKYFSSKLASFVIFLILRKLLAYSWVGFKMFVSFLIIQHFVNLIVIPLFV